MNKCLLSSLAKVPAKWKSKSRIYGEACEYWVETNVSCPNCGGTLTKLTANVKSVDHKCSSCGEQYQTKASKSKIFKKDGSVSITGAEYKTTLSNIGKWGIIALQYCPKTNKVLEHRTISRDKIDASCVIPRKPLGPNARRAGWQGCYIKII